MGERLINPLFNVQDRYRKVIINPYRFSGGGSSNGLLTNLVSYWKLDEESGTRVDSHGSNNLTDNNTVLFAAGKLGNAADFEADNSESLSINDNASLSITGAMTISIWYKPETVPASYTFMVSKYDQDGNQRGYTLDHTNTGKPRFLVSANGSSVVTVEGTTTLSAGTWYHIVGVFNPSTSLKIYVNGSLENTNSTSIPASIYDNTVPFRIGALTNVGAAASFADGLIDEVGIWNADKSAAVATLYGSGTPPAYSTFD